MRHALLGLAILMLGGTAYAQSFSSSEYCDPVCLEHRDQSRDCSYHSYSQCEASRSGVGGSCVDNPLLSQCTRGAAGQTVRHRRKHH
jgi:hypothetical protein